MARDTHPAYPPAAEETAGYSDFGLKAILGERIVTTIVIAIAVSVVASIAVLMGMD
jgi:hypothetical protein